MRKCSWIITDRLDFPEVPEDCFLLFWKLGAQIRTEVWVKNSERYFGVIFVVFCSKSAVTTDLFKSKCRFVVPWGEEVCLDDWSELMARSTSFMILGDLLLRLSGYMVNILIYRANALSYLFILGSEGENHLSAHVLSACCPLFLLFNATYKRELVGFLVPTAVFYVNWL